MAMVETKATVGGKLVSFTAMLIYVLCPVKWNVYRVRSRASSSISN